MSMQSVYNSVMKVAAPLYQRVVGAELNKMGKCASKVCDAMGSRRRRYKVYANKICRSGNPVFSEGVLFMPLAWRFAFGSCNQVAMTRESVWLAVGMHLKTCS